MNLSQPLSLRFKTLKFNLDGLNDAYEQTKRDPILDSGLNYNTKYPYNDKTRKLFRSAENLKRDREEILFHHIFNFTQTLFSIKDYLKKEVPEIKQDVENFFSNDKINNITRKTISNDLKHNPQMDLKYDFREVGNKTYIDGKTLKTEITMKQSWFYADLDSVEYCNKLYEELIDFMKDKFN